MTISEQLRQTIREQAHFRCGYCLMHQRHVYARMEIDHLHPQSHGGSDNEENLWLACPFCNTYKSDLIEAVDEVTGERVRLFNPRRQRWSEHFKFGADRAEIIGITPCGRATVNALRINAPDPLAYRRFLAKFNEYPPQEYL